MTATKTVTRQIVIKMQGEEILIGTAEVEVTGEFLDSMVYKPVKFKVKKININTKEGFEVVK